MCYPTLIAGAEYKSQQIIHCRVQLLLKEEKHLHLTLHYVLAQFNQANCRADVLTAHTSG